MLLVLSPSLFGFKPPLLVQLTPSERRGVYGLRPLPPTLTRGMLVTLPVPASVADLVYAHGWLPRTLARARVLLVKPVGAIRGETVCVQEEGVFLNGTWQAPVYRALRGVTLPVIRGCWTLGEGEVFLLSTRLANAFDGRYFGVLSLAHLDRWAVPLWTWE
jgi:type IV secretory pathway protease TraF